MDIVRIVRTKFLLVSLILIELFHSGVRVSALVSHGTFLPSDYILTHGVIVEVSESFPILCVVIVWAILMGVLTSVRAWVHFEIIDI